MASPFMTLGTDGSAGAAGSSGPPATGTDRYDADRLLAGYQAARSQDTLFDLRPGGSKGPGVGFDEFFDRTGQVRPAWTELADAVAQH